MIRFFRKEALTLTPEGESSPQFVELFNPKSEETLGTVGLEILPATRSRNAKKDRGIVWFCASVRVAGERQETLEGYYALHEGFGVFDTFPLRRGDTLLRDLTRLVEAKMYMIT